MTEVQERCRQAEALAEGVGTPSADQRLLSVLVEDVDTAVMQAGAEALLARGDLVGLRVYVRAFGLVGDPERDKLGDCLYDEAGRRWSQVEAQLPSLDCTEPEVDRGLNLLRGHMHIQARRHLPPAGQDHQPYGA